MEALLAFLVVAPGIAIAALLALVLLNRGRRATETPIRSWQLAFPRDPRFSPAQAAAWFGALAPLLSRDAPCPVIELRGAARALEVRLTAPAGWEPHLRSQLAAWFPEARLEPTAGEERPTPGQATMALPLALTQPDVYPLRLAEPGETDPLLGVFGLLSQAELPLAVRLGWGPAPGDWEAWAPAALEALRAGRKPPPRGWLFWLLHGVELLRGAAASDATGTDSASRTSAESLAGVAAKVRNPVFATTLTLLAAGSTPEAASRRCLELAAHLAGAFRAPFGNSLAPSGVPVGMEQLPAAGPSLALSALELGSLCHVPDPRHPLVPGAASRRVPPPASLLAPEPEPLTCFGEALHPERRVPFGLALPDRFHHAYVVGKTGTGKSTLLATLLRQDLEAGHGVGLIDPHGDLAELVLSLVPEARRDDLLYFNPADADFPVGFNPLAVRSPALRPLVASGVVSAFKKLFGESWGPRLEYFLRNAVLALLETPSPSLLSLPRLLTDERFRAGVLRHVRDPLLRAFFLEEYARYEPRWRAEAISPILNKVGQFLSSPVVRHVVGQEGPGFDLRELMDRRGIFFANLSSGRIGEDNTALLGALLVSAFQLAAMSRAELPEAERQPFFLCVDEFQHFATEAFAQILSEARKYRLGLTLSHQYLDQLPPGLSEAVFGNVGSLCVFRVGAGDTERLARELAPVFDGQDLVHLPNHRFCARITRGGEVVSPFSAQTLPLAPGKPGKQDGAALIAASRARWARPRGAVELEIADLWEGRLD